MVACGGIIGGVGVRAVGVVVEVGIGGLRREGAGISSISCFLFHMPGVLQTK